MKTIFRALFTLWILPVFGKSLLNLTMTYVDATGPVIRVGGKGTATVNYVAGGDTANLGGATQDPVFIGQVPAIESLSGPIDFDFWSVGGDITYAVFPVIGTTAGNCKVKFASALGSELAAGAYPSQITGDSFNWEAVFNKV